MIVYPELLPESANLKHPAVKCTIVLIQYGAVTPCHLAIRTPIMLPHIYLVSIRNPNHISTSHYTSREHRAVTVLAVLRLVRRKWRDAISVCVAVSVSSGTMIQHLGLLLGRVQLELDEDEHVLGDGAQGPEKPGESLEEVRPALGVGDQTRAVGEVAGQREEEEEQGETCCSSTRVSNRGRLAGEF